MNIARGSADDGIVAARRYVRREVELEVMTKDKADRSSLQRVIGIMSVID